MIFRAALYLTLVVLSTTVSGQTETPIRVTQTQADNGIILGPQLRYLEDSDGILSLSEVATQASSQWRSQPYPEINLGYNNAAAVWFTFALSNAEPSIQNYLLELAYPMLDNVELYLLPTADSLSDPGSSANTPAYAIGDRRPRSGRPREIVRAELIR